MVVKAVFFAMFFYIVLEAASILGNKRLKRITGKGVMDYRKGLEGIGRKASRYFNREAVGLKIRQAGSPFNMTPEVYFALKVLLPVLDAVFQSFSGGDLYFILGTGILAFFLPDLFLNMAVSDRKKSISDELPEVVDIFEAASSAGIDMGHVFRLAADFCRGKELKKELTHLAANYYITKDKEKCLLEFRDSIGLYDTDILTLALLQGDITGKTKGMLGSLASVQADNVIAKIQREDKASDYKVLLACSLMAFATAAIYFMPYVTILGSGLSNIFQ